MSAVKPTDKVLVYRAGIDHSAPADMSTVKDTDLLLINRAGVDYKCTFADWKASQVSIDKPTITSPADGAGISDPATAVGIDVKFLSSVFASSGGSLTHASSDWQIAALADTTFATPLFNAAASATALTSWTPGSLGEEIQYRARVRYTSATGEVSPWSNAVTFKTEKAGVAKVAPGKYFVYDDNNTLTEIPGPVKFVNASMGTGEAFDRSFLAVGVDGKCYKSPNTTGPFTELTFAAANGITNAVALQGAYRDRYHVVVNDKGVATSYKRNAVVGTVPDVVKLAPPGAVTDLAIVITGSGKVFITALSPSNSALVGVTAAPLDGAWAELTLGSTSPNWGSNTIVDFCGAYGVGAYGAEGIIVIASDGYLWSAYSPTVAADMQRMGVGTTGVPASNTTMSRLDAYGKGWKALYSISLYGGTSSFSALKHNGELWVACLDKNVSIAGDRVFSKWGDGYASGIVSCYLEIGTYAVKANGEVWGNIGGKVTTEADWSRLTTPGGALVKGIGSLAGNTAGASMKLPIIAA